MGYLQIVCDSEYSDRDVSVFVQIGGGSVCSGRDAGVYLHFGVDSGYSDHDV